MGKGERRIGEEAAAAPRESSRGRNHPPCGLASWQEEKAQSRFSADGGVVVTEKVTQEEGRFGGGAVVLGKQSRESLGDPREHRWGPWRFGLGAGRDSDGMCFDASWGSPGTVGK